MIAHAPVEAIAATGAATMLVATFSLEDQLIPLLTGFTQICVAAAIAWGRIRDAE
jgi:hypothetical protein